MLRARNGQVKKSHPSAVQKTHFYKRGMGKDCRIAVFKDDIDLHTKTYVYKCA